MNKCEKEHEQLAEWLEELKESRHCMEENRKAGYNHEFTDGFNKAICAFVGRLHFELLESVGTDKGQMEFAVRVIDIVAEQLKAGEDNV